jgi:hypothetical protein
MDLFLLATLVAIATWILKAQDQRKRITLLGTHLAKYQIEKHMETLTQGYLRALGEADPARREQIWTLLDPTAQALCNQFRRFVADFSRVAEADARVTRLPVALPFAAKLFPAATFDMREALAIHSRAICRAVEGGNRASPKDTAFTVSAELFLMQHTCHWFCKSRTTASARMLARHKTSYQQVLESVDANTRADYRALVG